MRNLPLVFGLLVISLSAAAEEIRIAPHLPAYRITPIFDASHIVDRLEIDRSGRRVQTLDECEVIESPPKGEAWLKTEDLNFDGYQDLLLLASWGATGNQSWCVWLFDAASSKFLYVPDLQLGTHRLNAKDKTIVTSSYEGPVYTQTILHLAGTKPVVVAERRGSWEVSRNLILTAHPEKPQYAPGEPVVIRLEYRNPGIESAVFVAGCCTYSFEIAGVTRGDEVHACACPQVVMALPPGKSYVESATLDVPLTRSASYRIKVIKQTGFAKSDIATAETEVVIR
jgi:hypothetical protein